MDPSLQNELEALKQAIEEFKQEGIQIKQEWIDELYEINKKEWDLLDLMNQERKREPIDYVKIGKLYLETELVNKKRSNSKNKIIEETGKGFKEIKKDHPSE
jgi:hypothetical protein